MPDKSIPQVHRTLAHRDPIKDGSATLEHFSVRNGYAWANVYVRTIPLPERSNMKNRSIEMLVNSDHGVYGHFWSHPGEGDWREFIAGLDMHYAMLKLVGNKKRFYRDPTHDEFVAAMRKHIDETTAQYAADGMEMSDGKKASFRDVLDALAFLDPDCPADARFYVLDQDSRGAASRHEMYEFIPQIVDEEVRNFWDRLFAPFQQHLRDEIATEKAMEVDSRVTLYDEGDNVLLSLPITWDEDGEPGNKVYRARVDGEVRRSGRAVRAVFTGMFQVEGAVSGAGKHRPGSIMTLDNDVLAAGNNVSLTARLTDA